MTTRKCIWFAMLIAVLSLWCAFSATVTFSQDDDAWRTDVQGNLIIHTDRVTKEPIFIPLMVNGNRMEILAIRAMDSKVRVAFNTCQVCSGAPRAYFDPQEGGVVCQNCGNFFPAEQVGSAALGCNPLAVPGVEVTASGDIVIPAAVLMAHVKTFRNWKRGL
ncbi:MAG: DUF2318 domain-containing protein [Desulfovibrio sp.]|nr:DUF2318 domain-containing protein [Desulfovibrio sp.]